MEILHLYRRIIKEGSKFKDYNFKAYVLRRAREDFGTLKNQKD